MKKRTLARHLSLLLTVVVVAGLVISGCGGQAAPPPAATQAPATTQPAAGGEVKIGALVPLTGGLAELGKAIKDGYETAAEIVNEEGGIKCMGGAKLKFVYADSGGKPDVGVSQSERLITVEKVAMISGAYQSSVTFPATEVAERYKIPWLVQGAVRDDLTDRGFKYLFRPNYKSISEATVHMGAVDYLTKQHNVQIKTVAFIYEATDWPMSMVPHLKRMFTERGVQIVMDEGIPPEATDLTSNILKIKAAKPDLLWFLFYTPQAILLVKGLQEHQVDTIVMSSGSSTSEPSFFQAVGPLADYIMTPDEWEIGILNVKPWAKPIADRYKAKAGVDLAAFPAQAIANVFIIQDVLERACSTDPEKLREALAATKITEEGKGTGRALIMPWKAIEFGPDGQNPHGGNVITQIRENGTKKYIVYPPEFQDPNYKTVFPPPKWSER